MVVTMRVWVSSLAVLLLTGCSPLNLPKLNEYTISPAPSKRIARLATTKATILVSRPVASPGYEGKDMLYMLTPYQLEAYTKSQWAAPPAVLMVSVLAEALRSSNYFSAVVTPPFTGKTDYQLMTRLVALHQSFLHPVSAAHLALHVTLIDSGTHRVLGARTFVRNQLAPGNNAYSGVLAANKAVRWAGRRITQFVVAKAKAG